MDLNRTTSRTPSGRNAPFDLRRRLEHHYIAAVSIRFQEQPSPPRPGTMPYEGDATGAESGFEAPVRGWNSIPFHPHISLSPGWAAFRLVRARNRPPGMY